MTGRVKKITQEDMERRDCPFLFDMSDMSKDLETVPRYPVPQSIFLVFTDKDIEIEKITSCEELENLIDYDNNTGKVQIHCIPLAAWGAILARMLSNETLLFPRSYNFRNSTYNGMLRLKDFDMYNFENIYEWIKKRGRGKNIYHICASFSYRQVWCDESSPKKADFAYNVWQENLVLSANKLDTVVFDKSTIYNRFCSSLSTGFDAERAFQYVGYLNGESSKTATNTLIKFLLNTACHNSVTAGICDRLNMYGSSIRDEFSNLNLDEFLQNPVDMRQKIVDITEKPLLEVFEYANCLIKLPFSSQYDIDQICRDVYSDLCADFAPADGATFAEKFFNFAEYQTGRELKKKGLSISFTEQFIRTAILRAIKVTSSYSNTFYALGNYTEQGKVKSFDHDLDDIYCLIYPYIPFKNKIGDICCITDVTDFRPYGRRRSVKVLLPNHNGLQDLPLCTNLGDIYRTYYDRNRERMDYSFFNASSLDGQINKMYQLITTYRVVPYFDKTRYILFSLDDPSNYAVIWEAGKLCV